MSKRKLTLVILILVALIAVLTLSACKSDTPFKGLDKSGYTVSVKFLANGGTVKGQQDLSMLDVYNLATAKTDENGNPTEFGQWRGNSGLFFMDHYEVQILDSYGFVEWTNTENNFFSDIVF